VQYVEIQPMLRRKIISISRVNLEDEGDISSETSVDLQWTARRYTQGTSILLKVSLENFIKVLT
jgi:hypothetical protein